MNKTFLYSELDRIFGPALHAVDNKITQRENEMVEDFYNRIGIKEQVKEAIKTFETLYQHILNEADIDGEWAIRVVAQSDISTIGVKVKEYDVSDDKLKALSKERTELIRTKRTLVEVVKGNTASNAFKLLKDAGLEINDFEKSPSYLPAIKIDLTVLNKYAGV